jgi:hypothetical protein
MYRGGEARKVAACKTPVGLDHLRVISRYQTRTRCHINKADGKRNQVVFPPGCPCSVL